MIYTQGLDEVSGTNIEVDEHIPLAFERDHDYTHPLSYIFVGNQKDQILEIVVDSDNLSIIRLVVINIDRIEPTPPRHFSVPTVSGVPRLFLSGKEIKAFERIDIIAPIEFYLSELQFIVQFDTSAISNIYQVDRLLFCLGNKGQISQIIFDAVSITEREQIIQALSSFTVH